MAERTRRTRTRRRRKDEEVAAEVEEVEDDEVEEEEEVEETPKRSRSRRSNRKVIKDEEPEDEDEDEEEEPEEDPKPARRSRSRKTSKKAPEPEPEEDEEDEDDVEGTGEYPTFEGLLQELVPGNTYQISRVGDELVVKVFKGSVPSQKVDKVKGKRGKEYDETVLTEEYQEWIADWREKTSAEKAKYAKKVKANWEEHDHAATNNMRMTMAVLEADGVQKYVPEYDTKAARAQLRRELATK